MTAVERDSPASAARGGELHEGFPSEADAPAAAGGTQPDPSTMAMAAIPRDKRIVSHAVYLKPKFSKQLPPLPPWQYALPQMLSYSLLLLLLLLLLSLSDVVLLSRGNGAAVMVVVDFADKAEEPGAAPLTSNATTATVHCPAAVRTHVDRRIVPQRLVTAGTEQADLCRNRQRGPVDGLLHKDHLLPS